MGCFLQLFLPPDSYKISVLETSCRLWGVSCSRYRMWKKCLYVELFSSSPDRDSWNSSKILCVNDAYWFVNLWLLETIKSSFLQLLCIWRNKNVCGFFLQDRDSRNSNKILCVNDAYLFVNLWLLERVKSFFLQLLCIIKTYIYISVFLYKT